MSSAWSDVAVAAFGDRHGSWGLLELWRTDDRLHDCGTLATSVLWQRYVVPGLRSSLARTFVDSPDQPPPLGPAVVVLDPDLQVRSQTAGAAAALLQLNPPDEPMTSDPGGGVQRCRCAVGRRAGCAGRRAVGWRAPWRQPLGDGEGGPDGRGRRVPLQRCEAARRRGLDRAEYANRADRSVRQACTDPLRETEVLALLGNGLSPRTRWPTG